jgi:proteasome lid subunit RPN8/RPN11
MNQNRSADAPDVGQLSDQELPIASFPGGRSQTFRVYILPEVHARLVQHAGENLGVEVCGVLVGSWGKDANGPFVSVMEAIRGEAATSKFAEVTFTHETWAKINHEMDTKFSQFSIVGWYHTHPDFGVFLSDRDVFIHQHFFSGAGQIAYVLDPVRKTEGIFVWSAGKPVLAPYYWVGDQLHQPDSSQREQPAAGPEKSRPARGPYLSELLPGQGSQILSWVMQALAFVALFLLGFIVAGRLNDQEHRRIEQDAIARSTLLLGIKPGLRETINHSLDDLHDTSVNAEALAGEYAQAVGQPSEGQQEKWNSIRAGLTKSQERLRGVQAQFCLTPAETERLVHYAAVLLSLGNEGLTAEERSRLARELDKALMQSLQQGALGLPPSPAKGKTESKELNPQAK